MRPSVASLVLLSACNTPPGAPVVAIGPQEPRTTDDLVVEVLTPAADPNLQQELSYRYRWTRDGAAVDDLTDASVPADRTARDELWEVSVLAFDGVEEAAEAATAAVTILNTPPVTTAAIEPAAPSGEDDLGCVAEASDADGDEIGFDYAWTVNGEEAGQEATLAASALARDDEVWCEVTPHDHADSGETARSATVVIGNVPPAVLSLAILPEDPRAGDTLTVAYEVEDADGDELTLAWAWTLGGELLGSDDSLASAFTKGDEVSVRLTPSDDVSAGEPATATVTIGNTPPVASALEVTPAEPLTDDLLTAVLTASDADGDELEAHYRWTIDGVEVGTGETLDGASAFSKGDLIALSAWAGDGSDDSEPLAVELTVGNTPPVITSATLDPSEASTDTLISCGAIGWHDPDGDDSELLFAWTVDGVAAGSDAYLDGSVAFDKGQTVICSVTPFDGEDEGAPASASLTVSNSPPSITGAEISPDPATTDSTLSCLASGWADADDDAPGYGWAWTVDGAAAGTDSTLDGGVAFDKDQEVTCTLTPDDGSDVGTAVVVSLTVSNSPPEAPGVSMDTMSELGVDLVCAIAPSLDVDGDPVSYGIDWAVDGAAWGGAVATTSHPGDTIAADGLVAGDSWTCTVTPDDGTSPGEPGSATTTICDPHASDGTACELVIGADEADVVIYGDGGVSAAGRRFATVGDTDGDGSTDLLVTANSGSGRVYLIPGPITAGTTLADGIALEGEDTNDYAGSSLTGLGDWDGDGFDDFAISAPSHDNIGVSYGGRLYLFYGPLSSGASSVADAQAIFEGSCSYDSLGGTTTRRTDIDGDGALDLITASPYAGAPGYTYTGAAHVFFADGYSGTYRADADADVMIVGSRAAAVCNVDDGGDHDGDGFDDLVFGAWSYATSGGSNVGAALLFTGPIGAGSYTGLDHDAAWYGRGSSSLGAAGVGDVDGDGYDDLLVTDTYDSSAGSNAGAAYLVLGGASPTTEMVLSAQVATLLGSSAGNYYPYDVHHEDVDGDGNEDILSTNYKARELELESGAMYVTFGPVNGTLYAEDTALLISGTDRYDQLTMVEVLDDLDGDGLDELGVASMSHSEPGHSGTGALYLFFEFP
jgi:hypothetical protein